MAQNAEERSILLDMFADLRVADVRDGMDWMMQHYQGSMTPKIRPLWRTRAVGIARTARYLPYKGTIPQMTPEEYTEWSGWYYSQVCTYPWIAAIEKGDFIVIDQSGVNAGLMGSNNTMDGIINGAVGYVSNGGVRDTDEIILQKIPFWSAMVSQGMVQGRLQFDACDIPVVVSGVLVHPGDVVVADGDGVIVVPQGIARDVSIYAHQELGSDKATRRRKYDALGLPPDETVL